MYLRFKSAQSLLFQWTDIFPHNLCFDFFFFLIYKRGKNVKHSLYLKNAHTKVEGHSFIHSYKYLFSIEKYCIKIIPVLESEFRLVMEYIIASKESLST